MRRRKSYFEAWQIRQSIAFSASFPTLPTSLMWFPGWQLLQPENFVFPVAGWKISFRLFTMSSLPGCSLANATPARSIAATNTANPDPFLTMRLSLPLVVEPERPSASRRLPEIFADVLSVLDFVLAADLVAPHDPVVLELVPRQIVLDGDANQFPRL